MKEKSTSGIILKKKVKKIKKKKKIYIHTKSHLVVVLADCSCVPVSLVRPRLVERTENKKNIAAT